MQDNAPSHHAADTITEYAERGVPTLKWPPCNPDSNLTEKVWRWMRDYVERYFPERTSYDDFREVVTKAWEAIPNQQIDELIFVMPGRCLSSRY